jgi:septum formation protein
MHFILGSQSRDRQKLLKKANIPFTVLVSDYEEKLNSIQNLKDLVISLAQGKSDSVLEKVKKTCPKIIGKEAIIICADTMVECEGEIIGKAKNRDDALRILSLLQGRYHEIHTGVVVVRYPQMEKKSFVETTKVRFAPLSKEMIESYLDFDEEYIGRAGAYSIEDRASLFIESVEGCRTNVAGLPMSKLRTMLLEFGIDLLDRKKDK